MPQEIPAQKTIIVVEDDAVLFESIRLHFKRCGWRCEWFAYAPSSMDEVRGLRADAALIDVNLPAGNGIDLIRSMRSSGINFPIVVMTGYIGAAEQARACDIRDLQVLMKPFDLRSLQETLSQALYTVA